MRMNISKKSKKLTLFIVIPLIGIIALSAAIFGLAYGYLNRSTIKLDFDDSIEYQTMKYFGASSCWNMRLVGRDETPEIQQELTNYLYGNDGLKLSIYRYNLGAGSIEKDEIKYGESNKTVSFFDSSKYQDNSSFLDPNNYDITRDADYLKMLKMALETNNVKKLVIFANSPHYLLTKNGLTHANEKHENNLPEENFATYSEYVLIGSTLLYNWISSLGYGNLEIEISPVNEPQWSWGGEDAGQEGCHYDYDILAKFYDIFYSTLNKYNSNNNTNFKMDIFESGNYKLGLNSSKNKKYFKEFSKYPYFDSLDGISMHSYAADTNKSIRRVFARYYKKFNKEFKMSEYCIMQGGVDTSVNRGIESAKVLMQDLNILNATEWSWWLGVAFGGWEDGLVYFDRDTKVATPSYRYYMYGQFMKYIDSGDKRIKADIHDLYDLGGVDSVGFKKADGSIVIVILNDNNKQKTIKIESKKYTQAKIVETYENTYWKESEKAFDGSFEIQPYSVTTIILK